MPMWRDSMERIAAALKYPVVLDGRNLYRPETMARHGLTYVSVGRSTVTGNGRTALSRTAGSVKE